MRQLATIVGFTAMLLFGICALEWIIMVLIPMVSGRQTVADLGSLAFWTVVTLAVWRIAAGRGWGFAARPR